MSTLSCHRWWPRISSAFCRELRTSPAASHGVWQVSSRGRICNRNGAISFGSAHASGYFRARMDGEDLRIHRVVAHAFLGPAPSSDAWQVHHKDGNPGNNHVTNLEYVTCSQNQLLSHASGTRRCGGRMRSKPVEYRAVGSKEWTRCSSQKIAALEATTSGLGIPQSRVLLTRSAFTDGVFCNASVANSVKAVAMSSAQQTFLSPFQGRSGGRWMCWRCWRRRENESKVA